MYENWANDPEVTKYLTWPTHTNVETSKIVLEDWVKHYGEEDYYQWAIVLKENGDKPIGSIGVVHKNDKIGMVHIGYCIGRKWWHRRITSESLEALIKFFIMDVGMNRVESRHDPHNPNSGKVMMKCGMKFEGTMRQADWNNQGICDFSEYGIIASDYNEFL
jgi:ribosomal-protein-alanine N-acetyltransferase